MENESRIMLDDVFNMFVAENDEPTAENLRIWIERYPQFGRELVEFAAAWAEQLVLPPAPGMEPATEKVLIDRAMSYVLNVACERDNQVQGHIESGDVVNSLTEEAQCAGMNAQELVKACRLDLALMSKLNRRLIEPKTIPAPLIGLFARQLRKPIAAIVDYLAQPPQVTVSLAFLARDKPTRATQQSFADAVRGSSLPEYEKARWLRETPDKED